jgi:hypothetical protein
MTAAALGTLVAAWIFSGSCARREPSTAGDADTSSAAPPLPAEADAEWTVTATGIGPVRAGMTLAEANAALGGRLDTSRTRDPNCDFVRLVDVADSTSGPRMLFMVREGRIARVDVVRDSPITTAAGARIGDTEETIHERYDGRVRVLPHHYVDGHYLIVMPDAPADTIHRIVFETDGRVVTRYRSGRYPEVEWVEGCS